MVQSLRQEFCDYVHLNPARARLLEPQSRLLEYPWSSFGWLDALDNAVKFVEAGFQTKVYIYSEPRGESVRLWVEDNGIGIARDARVASGAS